MRRLLVSFACTFLAAVSVSAAELVDAEGYDWAEVESVAHSWATYNLEQAAFEQCRARGIIGVPTPYANSVGCDGGEYCSDLGGCRFRFWCAGTYQCDARSDLPARPIVVGAESEADDGYVGDLQLAYRNAQRARSIQALRACRERGATARPPEFLPKSGYCTAGYYCSDANGCRWRAWCDGAYLCWE